MIPAVFGGVRSAPLLRLVWKGFLESLYVLFTDTYDDPGNYLNGTVPLDITGCVNMCMYKLNESTSNAINVENYSVIT